MTAGYDFGQLGNGSPATGFANQTSSMIAFNDGLLRFSIWPTVPGGSFSVWVGGFEFVKTAQEDFTWTDTEGLWFIYYNGAGVLSATQNATTIQQVIQGAGAAVAAFYWDATNNLTLRQIDERHNIALDPYTHWYLHTYFGTAYESGLGLSNFTIVAGNATLATHAQFGVASGVVADEDLRRLINDGFPQDITPILNAPIFYLSGPTPGVWRRKATDAFPVVYSGTAGYVGANGRLPFNAVSGPNWVLSEVTSGNFVLVHYFATTDISEPVIGVQGQVQYNNASAARAGALTEINTILGLSALLSTEKRAIATVIFQTATGYSNAPKAKVVVTDTGANFIDWRATAFFAGIAGAGTAAPLTFHLANGTNVVPSDLVLPPGAVQRSDGVHLYEGAQDTAWDNLNADGLIAVFPVVLAGLDPSSQYTCTLSVRTLFRTQVNNIEVSSVDFSVDLLISTDGASVATCVFQTTPSPDPSRLHATINQANCTASASAGGFTVYASRHPTTAMQARAYWWATEFVKL